MKAALLLLAVCGLTVTVRAISVSTEPRNSDYTSPVDPVEAETRDIPDTSPITPNGDRHLLQDTTPITHDGNRHLLQEGMKEDLIAAGASSSSGPSGLGEHGKVITVKGGQAHITTDDNGKLQDKTINTGRRLLWGWWGHHDHDWDHHDGEWHRDHDGYGRRLLWGNWGHEHRDHLERGHDGYYGGGESAASSSAASGESAAAAAGNHGRHLSGWFHRHHKDKTHHNHDKDHHDRDGDHHDHNGRHLLDWGGWHGGWWGDRHHDRKWDHRDGDWGHDHNRHGDRDGYGGDSSASSAATAGGGSAAADTAAGGYGK